MPILIVEDNPLNALVLENFLKKGGYQTVVARSAKDALANLSNINDLQLIITDLSMPDMGGLEFIANLKEATAYKYLPIIVVSAHSDIGTVCSAKDLQCNAYIVKPVDKKQLLTRVKLLLKCQSLVLQDKNHVMENLEVGAEKYDDLINALLEQLGAAIPIMVLAQAESGEAIAEDSSRLLEQLAESAAILGANRFSMLYSRLKGQTSITRSDCVGVLKVLQELDATLRAESKPS